MALEFVYLFTINLQKEFILSFVAWMHAFTAESCCWCCCCTNVIFVAYLLHYLTRGEHKICVHCSAKNERTNVNKNTAQKKVQPLKIKFSKSSARRLVPLRYCPLSLHCILQVFLWINEKKKANVCKEKKRRKEKKRKNSVCKL